MLLINTILSNTDVETAEKEQNTDNVFVTTKSTGTSKLT